MTPGSVEQVGCIHTCQGLELDYVGVIIGPDLAYRDGRIVTDATQRASSDQSVKGLKSMLKTQRESALALADAIVKNTYRTLMTRGMKGCYVYCPDAPLAAYLRSRLLALAAAPAANDVAPAAPATEMAPSNIIPLRRVTKAERDAGVAAAPVIDLRFAAGAFSGAQALEDGADEWVAVQHRSIADPETGERYTVKVYSSEKVAEAVGGWPHERITLRPDSDRVGFEPIEIDLAQGDEGFVVVGEMLMVLGGEGD